MWKRKLSMRKRQKALNKRMVFVEDAEFISVLIASGILIGDVHRVSPVSYVIAVQEEKPPLLAERLSFEQFSVFSMEPSPPLEPVYVQSYSYHNQAIGIDSIRVIGVSTSSLFQIGGVDHVDTTSRIKHIRLLKEA
ncbi:spore germination protein GerPE [Halobacillus fulvus]|nr:spore germination protein GerPE [Halobacillus fulvus]